MRARLLAATLAALLVPAASARAGDPIMPLGEVKSGLQCTGYSVVRGTEVVPFGIEVIDVIDDRSTGSGPRIMVGDHRVPARRKAAPRKAAAKKAPAKKPS